MATHEIGTLADFPEGRGRRVTVDGIELAVFNLDGELYGIQNRCPHKRLPLHVAGHERYQSRTLLEAGYGTPDAEKYPDEDVRGGFDREKPSVFCPWHFLEFDLATGENPVRGVGVATYEITVADDGTVAVTL